MYSEQDFEEINGRIRKNWLALAPVLAVLLAAYVYAFVSRRQWLAMTAGPLLFVAACYGFLAHLWPNLRYRGFLRDMQMGLSREISGTVVSISGTPEPQDGAMVLPVRLELAPEETEGREAARVSVLAERLEAGESGDTRNERILYLNASKRDQLPGPGTAVRLQCFGRHIRSVER